MGFLFNNNIFSKEIISFEYSKDTIPLSLKDAIKYGIEHNYKSINSKKDVEIAKNTIKETRGSGLPQIRSSVDYQYNFDFQAFINSAEDGGLTQTTFGTNNNLNFGLQVTQLLFDKSYLTGRKSAEHYLQIYNNLKEKTQIELEKEITRAYTDAIITKETISILKKNKKSIAEDLNETIKLYENGLTEEEQVLQLKILLSNIKSTYKNALSLNAISEKWLSVLLGTPNTLFKLTDNLDTLLNISIDTTADNNNDISNNIDYRISNMDIVSDELLLEADRAGLYPSISYTFNLLHSGSSNSFNFFDDFDLLKQDEQEGPIWVPSSYISLNLDIPIFTGLQTRMKIRNSKIELKKSIIKNEETKELLNIEYQKIKANYYFSVNNFNSLKANLELAEKILNKNIIKYKEGLTSSFDLTQKYQQLYQIQQEYLQSCSDLVNNRTQLKLFVNK